MADMKPFDPNGQEEGMPLDEHGLPISSRPEQADAPAPETADDTAPFEAAAEDEDRILWTQDEIESAWDAAGPIKADSTPTEPDGSYRWSRSATATEEPKAPPEEPPVFRPEPDGSYRWSRPEGEQNTARNAPPPAGDFRWSQGTDQTGGYPNQNYGTSGWSTGDYNRTGPKAENQGWQYGKQGRYQSGGYQQQGGGYYDNRQSYSGQQDTYAWNFGDYQSAQAARPRRVKGVAAFGIAIAAMVMLAVIAFAIFGIYTLFGAAGPMAPPAVNAGEYPSLVLRDKPDESGVRALADGELTTSEIAAKVKPSVVGIAVYTSAKSLMPTNEGSGIIIDSEGYIITNAHVVEEAAAISVILHNGDTYTGTVVGTDKRTDLAVLKIKAENLTYAEFGNSNQLMVGEKAVAIGNPGGTILAGTVTQGCISAVNRPLKNDNVTMYYVQTDAAINPGNSGGPLVNSYGQVIGINSSKIIATGYEGIGFAIPINDAKPIVDQIIQNGRVTRAVIGITGNEISPATSQRNDLPRGIYIWSIREGTDIATKDVREGDVITHIDGATVQTFDQVNDALANKKPGDRITLTIYRPSETAGAEGQTFDLDVILAEDTI